jgi:predicted dehydrogenase
MQINSKTLNIAILGEGDFSPRFLRRFLHAKMFGLCCGFNSHDYEELITLRQFDEVEAAADAVLLFDEKYTSYDYIKTCLRMCKHVFLGHPDLLTTPELNSLEMLAYEAGVKLQVSMAHRFIELNRNAKKQIQKPHIVECNHYVKRNAKHQVEDLVHEMLLPDIDTILHLSGERVKHVQATGVGVLFDKPDVVNARIEFYNGCTANLSVSKIADKDVHKLRFFENNSYHTLDYRMNSYRKMSGAKEQIQMAVDQHVSPHQDDTHFHDNVNPEEILVKEIESFYYCIALGSNPMVTTMEFVEARKVAETILDQLERNFRLK